MSESVFTINAVYKYHCILANTPKLLMYAVINCTLVFVGGLDFAFQNVSMFLFTMLCFVIVSASCTYI